MTVRYLRHVDSEGVRIVQMVTDADYDVLNKQLLKAEAALRQAKDDAMNINRKVSTFGLAHGMVGRINAYFTEALSASEVKR